jgi:pimeloyl-ACP methyl ester carboxylesterase
MKRSAVILIVVFCTLDVLFGQEKMKSDTFSFVFEGKKLSDILDMPALQEPSSIILIIQGSGQTNISENGYYENLRSHFVNCGLACFIWDKAGCGMSEGQFDYDQTVQNSAKEAIAAIEELKHRNITGSKNIGLWGLSRAGWICPLVIQEYPSIAFWISVSGTDDKENFAYLMESNLRIAGKSESEIDLLVGEWYQGMKIFSSGGSQEEYYKATQHLQKDSFCIANFGYGHKSTPEEYIKNQNKFINENHLFDEQTGLMIYIPNFREILNTINCPVLAVFGENDCNVDWRKTTILYQETIGNNKNADLTLKVLPNCNHSILKCKTGGINEDLKEWNWQPCDGYYETMATWLKYNGFEK